MPEGDTLHRAARRLQVLVGQQLEVETPHPRAQAAIDATVLDGRRLEAVEAVGKNLVLRFDGGVVLRSHLRMGGRWSVGPRRETRAGRPWLALRGERAEGVLWNGPVLELHTRALARLGPDILATPPDFDAMLGRLRRADGARPLGETLQDQSLVAGIGNMWSAEALWRARLSPWLPLRDVAHEGRRGAPEAGPTRTGGALAGGPPPGKQVHARAGRACRRCGTPIRSFGLGDMNRTAYWCPACQPGPTPG